MKSNLKYISHRASLLLLVLALGFSALANSGKEINLVDDKGLKQGYWVIKGYMTDIPNYDANSTVEEGEYINNKKEGTWKTYWPSGKLKSTITYKGNRPNGSYQVYYRNGQLEEEGIWKLNKNIGEFRRFHENGQPQQEFLFSDSGKRNGIQKYYHENGQLELEVNIINGKESGVMKRYYDDGRIKQEMRLENGTMVEGTIKNFNNYKPNDQKIEEIFEITEDKPDSEITEDEPNQAFEFKPNGYNVLYNAGQQVTQIGEFKNGRLWNGKWHRYNVSGILIRIEIYKGGKYIGTGVVEED